MICIYMLLLLEEANILALLSNKVKQIHFANLLITFYYITMVATIH